MRDRITVNNIVAWVASLFVIGAFVITFFTEYTLTGGGAVLHMRSIVYGVKYIYGTDQGQYEMIIVPAEYQVGPAIVPLIGACILGASTFVTIVISLTVSNVSLRKTIIGFAALFAIVGGILSFFVFKTGREQMILVSGGEMTMQQLEQALKTGIIKESADGAVATGVIAIIAGLTSLIAQLAYNTSAIKEY